MFVGDAPEFDRWLEQRRLHLAGDFANATGHLAAAATSRGDHAEAVALWHRLSSLEPHNARVAAQLARAMGAAGDRAGAVSSIHEFGTRLREDLALPMDAELVGLADRIRSELQARPEPAQGAAAPEGSAAAPTQGTAGSATQRPRRWRSALWSVAAVLTIAGILWSLRIRPAAVSSSAATKSIAVLSFAVRGDSATAYLKDGLARLVAHGLDGVGPLRASIYPSAEAVIRGARSAADTSKALAQRFQLDRYVTGDVTMLQGMVQVRAGLHDASREGRLLGIATVTGPEDSLFSLAAAVTRRLLGFEPAAGGGGLVRSASENTASLAAFQAFMDGEAHFRAAQFGDAVSAYRRAIREDTTFGLAYYRLSEALDWNAQGALVPAATAGALRFVNRLPWRERMLLEGSVAWRDARNDEAETAFRQIISRYPDDTEAWFQFAEVLFHSNSIRGRLFVEARAPFERVITIDPGNRAALTHLARIRAYQGDLAAADSLLTAAESMMATGPDDEMALFHAVVSGDLPARQVGLGRVASAKSYLVMNAVHRLVAYARDPALADTVLQRAVRAGLSPDIRREVHYWLAVIAATQGQFERATTETEAVAEDDHALALELQALMMTLPYSPFSSQQQAVKREELRRAIRRQDSNSDLTTKDGLGTLVRWYLLGLFAVRTDDSAAVALLVDSLEGAKPSSPKTRAAKIFATGLRSLALAERGASSAALTELARVSAPDGTTQGALVGSQLNERFLRGSLLEKLGRNEEALVVYGSLVYGDPNSTLLAVPAALRRARLLVRVGRLAEARSEYQTVLRGWAHVDTALQPVADSARRELALLP